MAQSGYQVYWPYLWLKSKYNTAQVYYKELRYQAFARTSLAAQKISGLGLRPHSFTTQYIQRLLSDHRLLDPSIPVTQLERVQLTGGLKGLSATIVEVYHLEYGAEAKSAPTSVVVKRSGFYGEDVSWKQLLDGHGGIVEAAWTETAMLGQIMPQVQIKIAPTLYFFQPNRLLRQPLLGIEYIKTHSMKLTELTDDLLLACIDKLAHLHGTFFGLPSEKLGQTSSKPYWHKLRDEMTLPARKVYDYLLDYQLLLSELYFNGVAKKEHFSIVHGDFHAGNWLFTDNGEPFFADFQISGTGPAFLDVANFMLGVPAMPADQDTREARTARYRKFIQRYVQVIQEHYNVTMTVDYVWNEIRWCLCLRPLQMVLLGLTLAMEKLGIGLESFGLNGKKLSDVIEDFDLLHVVESALVSQGYKTV